MKRQSIGILLGLILSALLVSLSASAQAPHEIVVRVNVDQILYSGPSQNSAWIEYIAGGREVVAIGRTSDQTWLEVNMDRQVIGWLPTANVSLPPEADLSLLRVGQGLLPGAAAVYPIDTPALRQAEVEAIRIQRSMRLIGARWFRLQAFLGASCEALPEIPAPPSFTGGELASVPQLERVQRELTYVQEQTELAILIYEQLCGREVEFIDEGGFVRGSLHINQAYNAWDVVRKYLNELQGLERVTR